MKILFLGGGNMCRAIVGGLVANDHSARHITVVEPDAETRAALVQDVGVNVTASLNIAASDWDAIILAVKPQVMQEAVAPLIPILGQALVISIAAGIRIPDLSRWLGCYPHIVRAMPNTPALIHAGVTGLVAAPSVSPTHRVVAETLLKAVGKVLWFDDEARLDAVTAISGSGPAYVFYFIEALEEAALALGFDAHAARELALETFRGASQLAAQSPESAATLRARVTSKRGTTERAIETFDHYQLKARFIEGAKASHARAIALGDELAGQAPH